jgi:hypothetical protein
MVSPDQAQPICASPPPIPDIPFDAPPAPETYDEQPLVTSAPAQLADVQFPAGEPVEESIEELPTQDVGNGTTNGGGHRSKPRMSIQGLKSRLNKTTENLCNVLDAAAELAQATDPAAPNAKNMKKAAKLVRETTGTIVAAGLLIPVMKIVGDYMGLNGNEIGWMANVIADKFIGDGNE